MLNRWNKIVFLERYNNSAISLFVFPSLTRLATRISMGVRPTNFDDNFLVNGETMLFRFDSRVLTRVP
jgi:hypothetical protein